MEVYTPPVYQEKRPPGRQPKLTHETRMLVGRKVDGKELTYEQAAKDFGISQASVGGCVKLFRGQGVSQRRMERYRERQQESAGYHHQAQLKELKNEIAELYLENRMLKKILSHSQRKKKEDSSVITSESLDRLPGAAD